MQVEAIKNIKIDKVTVWDSGINSNGNGGNSTANFLSGLMKSLPPLHDVAATAGLELPSYLGKMGGERETPSTSRPEEPRTPGKKG